MRITIGPRALIISAVLGVEALTGCQQHVETPPIAASPPPPPPPQAPPPPSADEKLQAELSQMTATPGSEGWSLSLDSGKFAGLNVRFDARDAEHLGSVVDLMKATPNLRLQIEAYPGTHGSKSHRKELAQIHADSVLRDMTRQGADEARIQAFAAATAATPQPAGTPPDRQKVSIIFSNAEGEFRQAAASR